MLRGAWLLWLGAAMGGCAGARSTEGPAPHAEPAKSGDTPAEASTSGKALRCGEQRCEGTTPLCVQDDAVAGGWRCAGEDDPAMFKMQCLTKDNCAPGEECCAGMTTRCVVAGGCDGGDTPLVACADEGDCPDTWYGMPVKGCEPGGNGMPGLKVCQIQ